MPDTQILFIKTNILVAVCTLSCHVLVIDCYIITIQAATLNLQFTLLHILNTISLSLIIVKARVEHKLTISLYFLVHYSFLNTKFPKFIYV